MKYLLTGKYRYRVHSPIFGSDMLVLQVEEQVSGERPGSGKPYKLLRWRDARVEDREGMDDRYTS